MLELCYLQSGMSKGVGFCASLRSRDGRMHPSPHEYLARNKKTALHFAARFGCCCPQRKVMQL